MAAAQRHAWIARRAARLANAFSLDRVTALDEAASDWQAFTADHAAKRFCCDHRCQQGRACPSFAPGTIEGPYRRATRRKLAAQAKAARAGLMGALRTLAAYLMGPRP